MAGSEDIQKASNEKLTLILPPIGEVKIAFLSR